MRLLSATSSGFRASTASMASSARRNQPSGMRVRRTVSRASFSAAAARAGRRREIVGRRDPPRPSRALRFLRQFGISLHRRPAPPATRRQPPVEVAARPHLVELLVDRLLELVLLPRARARSAAQRRAVVVRRSGSAGATSGRPQARVLSAARFCRRSLQASRRRRSPAPRVVGAAAGPRPLLALFALFRGVLAWRSLSSFLVRSSRPFCKPHNGVYRGGIATERRRGTSVILWPRAVSKAPRGPTAVEWP